MLHYLTECQLREKPTLADGMFKDRANQFVRRHKWAGLSVDENGWETDEYDRLNPLYIISESSAGTHQGSLRLLPMSGPNMLHDYFDDLVPKDRFSESNVWECTRFVKSRFAPRETLLELLSGLQQLFAAENIDCVLGLFNYPMLKIYKALEWEPEVIAERRDPTAQLLVGRWKKLKKELETSRSSKSTLVFPD